MHKVKAEELLEVEGYCVPSRDCAGFHRADQTVSNGIQTRRVSLCFYPFGRSDSRLHGTGIVEILIDLDWCKGASRPQI